MSEIQTEVTKPVILPPLDPEQARRFNQRINDGLSLGDKTLQLGSEDERALWASLKRKGIDPLSEIKVETDRVNEIRAVDERERRTRSLTGDRLNQSWQSARESIAYKLKACLGERVTDQQLHYLTEEAMQSLGRFTTDALDDAARPAEAVSGVVQSLSRSVSHWLETKPGDPKAAQRSEDYHRFERANRQTGSVTTSARQLEPDQKTRLFRLIDSLQGVTRDIKSARLKPATPTTPAP